MPDFVQDPNGPRIIPENPSAAPPAPQQPPQAPPQVPDQSGGGQQPPPQMTPEQEAWAKMSPDQQAQYLIQMGYQKALQDAHEQGFLRDPHEPPPQPQAPPPPEENPVIKQFRQGLNEKLQHVKDDGVRSMLSEIAEYTLREAAKVSGGISQQFSRDEVAKQTRQMQEYIIERTKNDFFASRPDFAAHRQELEELMSKDPSRVTVGDHVRLIDAIVNSKTEQIRQEVEARSRPASDDFDGFMERSARGRVSPQTPDRKAQADAVVKAAGAMSEEEFEAAMSKWFDGR